jgi:putative oxygen-independent coproporphyrinogen III oxidase
MEEDSEQNARVSDQGSFLLTPDPWPRPPAPGLYLHVPFCRSKCPYCDFYSITSPELIPIYLSALDKEAQIYHAKMLSNSGPGVSPVQAQAKACGYPNALFFPFDTLYLGGGTPSLLDNSQLTTLLAGLRRNFRFGQDCETTIEANPDDVTAEKLRLWRDLGVNRLSLGVQSLDEQELRFLGRRHTARQARRALELARAAGFENLSVDLIYGLPGQREESWSKTLEQIRQFNPEHLSCYQLTIAAGETPAPQGETPALRTPFARRAAPGEISLPDEEAQRGFFLFTSRFLVDQGYLHYEVSNFAREEKYCCRHNLKYWRHVPYLGLGPGAHSFDGSRRWWNFSSVEEYGSSLNAGQAPVAGAETLTPAQLRLEALYLGFRTREGVSLDLLRPQPRWRTVLAELRRAGLVRLVDGRLVTSPQGMVVADRLPLCFAD